MGIRIIVLAIIIWLCSGSAVHGQQGRYRIHGIIDTDKPVNKAYLYGFNGKRELLDSTKVVDKKFVFGGRCPLAIAVQIEVEGLPNSVSFFLEQGEFDIRMMDSWQEESQVIGGFQNTIEKAYASDIKSTKDILDSLYLRYERAQVDERVDLSSEMEKWNKQLDNVRDSYIRSYPNSLAVLHIIEPYIDIMSYQELSRWVTTFSPELEYADVYKRLINKHKERETEQLIGRLAPDIVSNTADGTAFRLSSLRGKFVLLDFWASWCAPCRVANRKLIPIYEKYRHFGFEMVSVSMDDKEHLWKAAIKADNIPWIQVSDLEGLKASRTAKKYFVQSLPTLFLIDQDGKVMAQNIGKDELEKILKERLH